MIVVVLYYHYNYFDLFLIVCIEIDPLQEEAHFLKGCCWVRLGNPDRAYSSMKNSAIHIEAPSRSTLCLCAYISTHIQPPRYQESVDSYTAILKNNANDFDAVSI